MLKKQPYDNTVDWWCLGSVLYEMLFGLVSYQQTSKFAVCYWIVIIQAVMLKSCLPLFSQQPPFYSRDTHEMYDNILHKDLVMRPGASTAAWSILQALLEKDHTRRLGYRNDFVSYLVVCVLLCLPLVEDLFKHFSGISWI